ncbi:MAG: sigma-70 family RNA polymerase sigma factor [Xanthomonadales bacterium]|nr:sigma-70 family RNA polymerase sigma factor [Xanthomonadales bacterium]
MVESTAAQYTTAGLLARVRAGDASARDALVSRVEPLLRRFAQGRVPELLRHEHDTGDLVQLTWTRVLARLDAIQTQAPGDFFAYLRTVLINALREALRRREGSPVVAGGDVAEVAAAALPAQHVDPADWIAYEQSLAALAPEHRALVLMRFEFGMSFAEIAAELGESADGVRMKLNRAIARMAGAADDGHA